MSKVDLAEKLAVYTTVKGLKLGLKSNNSETSQLFKVGGRKCRLFSAFRTGRVFVVTMSPFK